MIPVEKPGTPSELVHHGIKGMRWGVRKEDASTGSTNRKSTTKKAVVGISALGVAAGAGFVAYKLSQHGSTPISAVKLAKDAERVKSFLDAAGEGGSQAQKYAEMFLKEAGR